MNKIHSIKELKTGDVVVFRNSLSGIVIKDLNAIVMRDGFTNLDSRKSFKSDAAIGFDILRVYRPERANECRFYTPAIHNDSNMIYESNEARFWDDILEEALSTPTLYELTPDRLVLEEISEEDKISYHVYNYRNNYYIIAYKYNDSNLIMFRKCTKDEVAIIDKKRGNND